MIKEEEELEVSLVRRVRKQKMQIIKDNEPLSDANMEEFDLGRFYPTKVVKPLGSKEAKPVAKAMIQGIKSSTKVQP